MPFDIALTGLNAAQKGLEVISNNIANSETTGFKQSRAEFADIYARSDFGVANNAIGQGAQLADIRQEFKDGDLTFTENSLDLAINGSGFFTVEDEGTRLYTRAGAFGLDLNGNIVNSSGNQLIGFVPDSNGNISGSLGPIVVDRGDIAPQVTTAVQVGANVDAGEATPAGAFNVADPATFNHSMPFTVNDSLGGEQLANLYFRRNGASDWQVFAFVDGTQVSGPDVLNFDNNGNITGINGAAGTTTLTTGAFAPGGVGATTTVTFDYSNMTQYGNPFSVTSLSQDGYSTGRLSGLDVGEDGTVFARYSNGQSGAFGQIVLTSFNNIQGLSPTGNSQWVETIASGEPLIGAPGTTDLGLIQAGALEDSNVDVTAELIDMIQTQRFFQANAQVIGAADELTQTIINIT